MSNTIPPFHPGQKVVCVNPLVPFLIKDELYIIDEVLQCPKCKLWMVTLSMYPAPSDNYLDCSNCPEILVYGRKHSFGCRASRFAPIISDMQAITFEKVVEQELISVN